VCGKMIEKALGSAVLPLRLVMLCWINGIAAQRVKQNCLLLSSVALLFAVSCCGLAKSCQGSKRPRCVASATVYVPSRVQL
jgi:hypothetical protein